MSKENAAVKSRIKCREIMTKNPSTATESASLQEIAALLKEGDIGILPIRATIIHYLASERLNQQKRFSSQIRSLMV